MAHDVFISYSTKDKVIADAICNAMETSGIRCWIAPRDIQPGREWPEAIDNAISTSSVMVLIFSAHSNNSKDVAKELTLAMNSNVIVIPFRIEDIVPKGVMRYYLSDMHWLDAMNPPTEKQILNLVDTVSSFMGERARSTDLPSDEAVAPASTVSETLAAEVESMTMPVDRIWLGGGITMVTGWLISLLFLDSFPIGQWFNISGYMSYLAFIVYSYVVLIPAVLCIRKGAPSGLVNMGAKDAVSQWLWALPAVLGFIGGVASWLKLRNTNGLKALNMLTLGILLTPFLATLLITDEPAPKTRLNLIGSWPASREAHSVYVKHNTAYLANGGDGLVILDISDLTNPEEIGAYPLENTRDVIVIDDIAYVTEQGLISDGRALSDKLVIIDVGTPSEPQLLGEYTPEDKHVHSSLSNLAVNNQVVFLTISDRLIMVDASNPSKPQTLGIFEYQSNISSPGVDVIEDLAFIQGNRLHVVDISDPKEPVEIGGFDPGWGSNIEVINDTAYISTWGQGLTILDVSNPSRPIKLGDFNEMLGDPELLPPGVSSRQTCLGISVSGDLAFMTYHFGADKGTWTQVVEGGIAAIDISNPENPVKTDQYTGLDDISSIFAMDDIIFVTAKTRGLLILENQ